MEQESFVKYPLGDVSNRPVINIGGRDYIVMPYTNTSMLPKQGLEMGLKHDPDWLKKQIGQYAAFLMHDAINCLKDAIAVTTHKSGEGEDYIEYQSFLPVLVPLDTKDRWFGDEMEIQERILKENASRYDTGKPFYFKLVE